MHKSEKYEKTKEVMEEELRSSMRRALQGMLAGDELKAFENLSRKGFSPQLRRITKYSAVKDEFFEQVLKEGFGWRSKAEQLLEDGIETKAGVVKVGAVKEFNDSITYCVRLEQPTSPTEKTIGSILIELSSLDNHNKIPSRLYSEFKKKGMEDYSLTACIFRFRPFGGLNLETLSPDNRELTEKGVATAAVVLVLADLKLNELAGVWMDTREKPAQKLMEENLGFKKTGYYLFRVL